MFPIDMPKEIGSKQWTQWFQKQPPMVQNQVVSTITMSQVNDSVPQSSSVGGYAPELDPTSFGLLDQQMAPPALDKYGNVEPYDLDVAAKTENLLQGRNTYLIDNAAAMQAGAGAYNAGAFDPIVTPTGSPLQQPGTQLLAQYAGSGGSSWQSYMADAMLNRGLDPAGAQAEMMAFISAPETKSATPEEQQQRAALKASLPGKAIEDPVSGTFTFGAVDPKNLANTVDVGKIFKWADEGYQKMATDPILDKSTAYQDPTSGQWYPGSKSEPSTAAKWYQDRGLALPTDTYTDPEYLSRVAPMDQNEIAALAQQQAGAETGAKSALADFQKEKANYDQMVAAWKATQDKMQAERDASMQVPQPPGRGGVPGPGGAPGGVPFGGSPSAPGAVPFGGGPTSQSPMGPGSPLDNSKAGGYVNDQPMYQLKPGMGSGINVLRPVGERYDTVQGKRFQDVSPFIQGPPPAEGIGWDKLQEMFDRAGFGGGAQAEQGGAASGVFGGAQANDKVPTAEDLAGVGKRAMPTNMNFALGIPGLANQIFGGGGGGGKKKSEDVDWGKAYEVLKQQYGRQETSREKNKRAIEARSQAQAAMPQGASERMHAYAAALGLEAAGRTRLGDQLAQRALAARAAGLYGY